MDRRIGDALRDVWTEETKRALALSALSAAAFSFAAHGFLFANEFFSHDSVSYYVYSDWGLPFYTGVGRFLIPAYEQIKGNVAAPWLIGLLFILWTSLAAFLISRLLEIRSTAGLVLAAGLVCTNLSLTATGATYVYCMDEYALSLALAAAAALLFQERGWRCLWGLLPLAASLAVYQSYVTVAASLCLLAVLRMLARGAKPRAALGRGLRSLGLLALGAALYYGAWTGLCALLGVAQRRVEESALSGGLSAVLSSLGTANERYVWFLRGAGGALGPVLPWIHALLLIVLGWRLLRLLADRAVPGGSRALLAGLVCLLPTAFGSACVLAGGPAHILMTFAQELLYLLPLLALEPPRPAGRWERRALCALLCVVLWHHVVFANQAYMKKDLEKNTTLVLASQIVNRIEGVEGYVPGETPIAFAGVVTQDRLLARQRAPFAHLEGVMGLGWDYAVTYNLGRYLMDYLNYPLLWDTSRDYAVLPEVEAMPLFPAQGSVAMVEGTVVIKLSERT